MNKLNTITVDSENKNFKSENGKLLSKDGKILYFIYGDKESTTITIQEGIEKIESGTLSIIKNVETVKLPASMSNITVYMFDGLENLQTIEVDPNNEKYKNIGKGVYSKNGEDLIIYIGNENKIEIPEGVKRINGGIKNKNASEIILPNSLEKIGGGLGTLYNVKIINIPSKVNEISPYAFSSIKAKIRISEQNQTYKSVNDNMILSKDGKNIYWVNRNLENIEIPNTVDKIDRNAFSNSKIIELNVPNTVKTIEAGAFYECSNLSKIVIPNSVNMIGSEAFKECKVLKEIIIEKPENSISGAPWGCPFGNRSVKWMK